MLENIATAHSEYKASYNTDYIVPDLINFSLAMIEKQSKCRLKIGIFIFVKSIAVTKNWFAVSNFLEFPKHHTEK